MQVFKTFFMILKKSAPQMCIYLGVFLGLSIMFTTIAPSTQQAASFEPSAFRAAVINKDADGELSKAFVSYLEETAELVDIGSDREALQDAMFFRKIDCVITIPENFSADFLAGKDPQIQTSSIKDSVGAVYAQMQIDKYWSTAELFRDFGGDAAPERIGGWTAESLREQAVVQLSDESVGDPSQNQLNYHFRYLCYVMIALMILGITSIMMSFNKKDLRMRNLCSPLKLGRMNLQIVLASLLFSVASWAILVGLGLILYMKSIVSAQMVLLFCLNSFVMMLCCLSIGYLASLFVKNRNVQGAVYNIASLGLCFLSGVFVPQQLLGSTVKAVASFTPTFWYVKANDEISALSHYDWDAVSSIVGYAGIQLAFAATILLVALAIGRYRRRSNA
ncbi:ABC transporter permease [Candidatus Soleaferrea massiliensis]|uniref:ABC transporter permease n=1 Tax=Candidatus Soleaferrea massiliensis TaxID=1470354 RepID=UPI00058C1173|nr:ABC transporter permease [Candidatus Soleaferrea massiliensis]